MLSIIIVNYNVQDLLQKCLQSIRDQRFPPLEVFVVDNNSKDQSIEMVRSRFPEVNLIANDFNAGFPKANNQAIKLAKGDLILLLNPDTELTANSLKDLVQFLDEHNDISILAPRLLNTDGTIQKSIQPFINIWEIIAETFFLQRLFKKARDYNLASIDKPMKVEALSGAAILARNNLFDSIGLLDEDLFWTEDMEFCYRAHKHGFDSWYLPDVKIVHHVGASGKQNQRMMISSQVLTKITFFRKNHSVVEFWIAWLFRLLHILSRLLILFFVSIFVSRYREKFDAYLFTLGRFIKGNY